MGYADVDMQAFMAFRITESNSVTLRWEVSSLFNRTNFNNSPDNFSGPVFGQITSPKDLAHHAGRAEFLV